MPTNNPAGRPVKRDYEGFSKDTKAGMSKEDLMEKYAIKNSATYQNWRYRAMRYGLLPRYNPVPERIAKFLGLNASGVTDKEIAAKMGVTVSSVWHMRCEARARGLVPQSEYFKSGAPRSKRRLGSISQILDTVDAPVRKWIMDQVPADASVADVLKAFAEDAYYEENQL
jgi:hypothetical protein